MENMIRLRKEQLNKEDFKLAHIPSDQRNNLLKTLLQNSQVFSKNLKTLCHTDLVIPDIKFLNSHPTKALPFPVPQALEAEAKSQLSEMINANIINRANSSWTCPMLLVKKKRTDPSQKQKYRLALDLRLLNAIIIPASYPLPKINNLISQLSKYKFFSTLDMPNAYWQIALPKEFQDKLSFITPWGTFTYNRLVFGLKTAASTFQQLVDQIIQLTECDNFPNKHRTSGPLTATLALAPSV